MDIADKIAKENPDALNTLVKSLLRPLQSQLIISVIENDEHKSQEYIYMENFFCEGLASDLFVKKHTKSLPAKDYNIELSNDIVLPIPWVRDRIVNSFTKIGTGKVKGNWIQDSNHFVTLWLPWKISFVDGGNHSIAVGIIEAQGTLVPNCVFDMSNVFNEITCDGNHYHDIKTDQIIAKVEDPRIAAVFEIGRLIKKFSSGSSLPK